MPLAAAVNGLSQPPGKEAAETTYGVGRILGGLGSQRPDCRLSRPADSKEAIPDRCAEAVLQERPEQSLAPGTPGEGKGRRKVRTSAPLCAALIESAMEFRSMLNIWSAECKEIKKKAKRASGTPAVHRRGSGNLAPRKTNIGGARRATEG
jgi:hypothetical protein